MILKFVRIPGLRPFTHFILLLAFAGVSSVFAQQSQAPEPSAQQPQAQSTQSDQQSSSSQEATPEESTPVRKKKAPTYDKWTFNAGGGASLSSGDTGNFVRGGGGIAAVGVARNAGRYLGLRVDFQFDNLPLRTSALELAQAPSANSHAYTLMLGPIVNIPVTKKWGGYVVGGMTFLHRSGSLDSSSAVPGSACNNFFQWWGECFHNTLPINGDFLHASQNQFGGNFGGGITRKITPKFELYGEFRFVQAKHDNISTNFRPITVGLRW